MTTVLMFIVLLKTGYILTQVQSAAAPFFRKDYQYVPAEAAFYKVHTTARNWAAAKFYCQAEGATLVAPENNAEATIIVQLFTSQIQKIQPGVFIGFHDIFSEGNFVSTNGDPISDLYHEWSLYEPNDANNNEDCVLMRRDGKLNDENCQHKYPFVCKKTQSSLTINRQCETSDLDYFYVGEQSRCYKLHLHPKNWTDAYTICQAEESYLAIINSAAEVKVLVDELAKHPVDTLKGNFYKDVALLGYHDQFEEGEFNTITGQSLEDAGYDDWGPNQPDNSGATGEHCGSMFRGGQLNDVWCGHRALFFCERELNAGIVTNDVRFSPLPN